MNNQRYLSLDIMRGLVIAMMIVVNTPGSWSAIYTPFDHTVWNGCTPTDWVFPSFLFMIGVSMRFSFKSLDYSLTKSSSIKILKRGIMLYGIYVAMVLFWRISGALINHKTIDLVFFQQIIAKFRFFGVLPRIAITYILAAFLVLSIKKTSHILILSAIILLSYWLIMYSFGDYQMLSNAGYYLDKYLLGEQHLWHGEGVGFEPEGILSTLPATVSVLLGYLTGEYIQNNTHRSAYIIKSLIVIGAFAILISELWNPFFPINKKLWTSSFVLHVAGIDCLILAVLMWWIDIKGNTKGTFFFKVLGMNAIAAFVISELPIPLLSYFKTTFDGKNVGFYTYIYKAFYVPLFFNNLKLASMAFALSWLCCCWLLLYVMYRKKVFLKV